MTNTLRFTNEKGETIDLAIPDGQRGSSVFLSHLKAETEGQTIPSAIYRASDCDEIEKVDAFVKRSNRISISSAEDGPTTRYKMKFYSLPVFGGDPYQETMIEILAYGVSAFDAEIRARDIISYMAKSSPIKDGIKTHLVMMSLMEISTLDGVVPASEDDEEEIPRT